LLEGVDQGPIDTRKGEARKTDTSARQRKENPQPKNKKHSLAILGQRRYRRGFRGKGVRLVPGPSKAGGKKKGNKHPKKLEIREDNMAVMQRRHQEEGTKKAKTLNRSRKKEGRKSVDKMDRAGAGPPSNWGGKRRRWGLGEP